MFLPFFPDPQYADRVGYALVPVGKDPVGDCFRAIEAKADLSNDPHETLTQLRYTIDLFAAALCAAQDRTTQTREYPVWTRFGAMTPLQLEDIIERLDVLALGISSNAEVSSESESAGPEIEAPRPLKAPNPRFFSGGWIGPAQPYNFGGSGGIQDAAIRMSDEAGQNHVRESNRAVSLDSATPLDPYKDLTRESRFATLFPNRLSPSRISPLPTATPSSRKNDPEDTDTFSKPYFKRPTCNLKERVDREPRFQSSLNKTTSPYPHSDKISQQLDAVDALLESDLDTLSAQTERVIRRLQANEDIRVRQQNRASADSDMRMVTSMNRPPHPDGLSDSLSDLIADPESLKQDANDMTAGEFNQQRIEQYEKWRAESKPAKDAVEQRAKPQVDIGHWKKGSEHLKNTKAIVAGRNPVQRDKLKGDFNKKMAGLAQMKDSNVPPAKQDKVEDPDWEFVSQADEDWDMVEDEGKKEVEKYLKRK
jgi:hypothetical protein